MLLTELREIKNKLEILKCRTAAVDYFVAKQPKHIYNSTARRHMIYIY